MYLSFAKKCPVKKIQNIESFVSNVFENIKAAKNVDVKQIQNIELALRLLVYVIDPNKFASEELCWVDYILC